MTRIIPSQKVITLQSICDDDLAYKFNKEYTAVDCPDCFDTMIKIYDSDKVRYQCENCDLIIPEMSVEGFNE